ncbi:MAG: T9SS type A sorting domain-containing protein [Bacteroidota bacterium]
MKHNYFTAFALGLGLMGCFGFIGQVQAQGMVLNEFSNGDAGTREYMEFVVVGPDTDPNCGPVDLRGWIIDDNNGDFSCGPCSGSGIAMGHLRLAAHANWEEVNPGSIIVVYNDNSSNTNGNVPAADPNDTAPADGVYVVPASSAMLEVSTATACGVGNIPAGVTSCPGPCSGNATYAGACYTAGGSWANAGMRNGGDAAQVRQPDGTYFHGVGYGSGMNGGPESIYVSGTGNVRFFMFDNSVNDDYRSAANWSSQTVASNNETPGAPNNSANAAWINTLIEPCILPVAYAQELQGAVTSDGNFLSWITATEVNCDHFVVERSTDLSVGFAFMTRVEGQGNSSEPVRYGVTDPHPAPLTWYRLRQVDRDGRENMSTTAQVVNHYAGTVAIETWPNPADRQMHFRVVGSEVIGMQLMDRTGRIVWEMAGRCPQGSLNLQGFAEGIYLLQVHTQNGVATRRISCLH